MLKVLGTWFKMLWKPRKENGKAQVLVQKTTLNCSSGIKGNFARWTRDWTYTRASSVWEILSRFVYPDCK